MAFHFLTHPHYHPARRVDPFDLFEPHPRFGYDPSFAGALGSSFFSGLGDPRGGMQLSDTEVKVAVDAKHFTPEELEIKIVEDEVVIHGKHEEKDDEHGSVSREFTRRYKLPEDVDPTEITSSLSHNGILSICAPRKGPQATAKKIPITIEPKPAIEGEAAKAEGGEAEKE